MAEITKEFLMAYSYSTSNIVTQFVDAEGVTTEGLVIKIVLQGVRDGFLRRVKLLKISDSRKRFWQSAPFFIVSIYDKKGSIEAIDTIFKYSTNGDADPALVDEVVDIVFKNRDQEDCLWMKIVPSAYINNYKVRVDVVEGGKLR